MDGLMDGLIDGLMDGWRYGWMYGFSRLLDLWSQPPREQFSFARILVLSKYLTIAFSM
jgi:hypothetical protein